MDKDQSYEDYIESLKPAPPDFHTSAPSPFHYKISLYSRIRHWLINKIHNRRLRKVVEQIKAERKAKGLWTEKEETGADLALDKGN